MCIIIPSLYKLYRAIFITHKHNDFFFIYLSVYICYRAFLITDMQSRKQGIIASGATAVSVLLKNSVDGLDRTLYVGNVGDSRAVLVTSKAQEG